VDYTFFSPGMRVTVFVCLTSSFWGVFCWLVFVAIFVLFSRSFVGLSINIGVQKPSLLLRDWFLTRVNRRSSNAVYE